MKTARFTLPIGSGRFVSTRKAYPVIADKTDLHNELVREVCRIIGDAHKDGTCGMGFETIYAHLNVRAMRCLPAGTNASYFIKEALRGVLAERRFASFVL